MNIAPLEYKPDYETALARHEAFWERAVFDRPPVAISFKKTGARPFPKKEYSSQAERWLDIEYRAEKFDWDFAQTDFLYDALPVAFPNLGPEIFSAWCGCRMDYGESTSWTTPSVADWERDYDGARLDMTHPLFKTLTRFTELLIERGRGKFIAGLTDFHPGGDHLAALRDPQELCVDLMENPEWVKRALERSMCEYYAAYGAFASMILGAGMPLSSWLPLAHAGTFYIPSNDFSCMISHDMFEEFFLPGIARECRFYERSIYHLDGPNALRHLDSLLAIPELDAVQWVCGAGSEGFARWRDVYKRIQRAGKGIFLACDASEIDDIIDSLRPEGVFFGSVSGLPDRDCAEAFVSRVSKWR